MRFYLKKKEIHKHFKQGLVCVGDKQASCDFERNTGCFENIIKSQFVMDDYDLKELKRLFVLVYDNKIVLNSNSDDLSPILSKRIKDYDEQEITINATDFCVACPAIKLNNQKCYYYEFDKCLLFINVIQFNLEYEIEEQYLYSQNKIKNTFFEYMDRETKMIYNQIIFPCLNELNKKTAFYEDNIVGNIKYEIKNNKIIITLPDGREGTAEYNPDDIFNLNMKLSIAFNNAMNSESVS